MINFTVGPVQSCDAVHRIGAEDVPYFRTAEFSKIMLENERLMLRFAGAPEGSRAVFLTGSGTASMEAVVMNVLTQQDRALVVNGGSFGARFCKLCEVHSVPHDEIRLGVGCKLREEDLTTEHTKCTEKKYSAFIVNKHEYGMITLDLIEQIKSFAGTPEKDNIRCITLKEIFLKCDNNLVKNRILEISQSDARLAFYLSPITYEGDVDVQWLRYIDEDAFKILIKRDDVIQHIISNYDPELFTRYWKVY